MITLNSDPTNKGPGSLTTSSIISCLSSLTADYYSIEDRTSGMADFVFFSALGMTAGPAIAASLSIVAPANQSSTNSYWTIETAPGEFHVVFT